MNGGGENGVGEAAVRTLFEWGRIRTESDWLLPVAALVAGVAYIVWMYRRDARNLRRRWAFLLCGLRCAAAAALFVVFLQPQLRSERDVVRRSRALVLVDTSLSMGFADGEGVAEGGSSAAASVGSEGRETRADTVARELATSEMLETLRATHDVVIGRFDETLEEVAVLAVAGATDDETTNAVSPEMDAENDGDSEPGAVIDFAEVLSPRGAETRLGDAVAEWIYDQRALPVAGMIVISDGGQNGGEDPRVAAELAAEARIPLFLVGMGSATRPANVRVHELVAPTRAYPGDAYRVTGYVQGEGFAGESVTVELETRAAEDETAAWTLEAAREVVLGEDGETVPVEFELSSAVAARYLVRLSIAEEGIDQNVRDNEQTVAVDVVERKTTVLLFAGGPTREYRFLRNMLHRDGDVLVDVVLQTGQEGVNQDARQVLTTIPETADALFEYDVIVAMDPDWTALSDETIDLVERFVAEAAGGLVVVAGPIHTDSMVNDARLSKIRGLYPVEFQRHLPMLGEGRFASEEAWPLEFTSEGKAAEFLWLGDVADASGRAWASFDGVYGYYSVRRPKPGATVYASFSAPASSDSDEAATYFAGQFYGAGRVFYAASGEMWRLRALDEAYFEQFYTKVIRHVAQGRLSRDADGGVLLVERDRYWLGDTVTVRAQITAERAAAVEGEPMTLRVVAPDGGATEAVMEGEAERALMYAAEFEAGQVGFYELEVGLPGGRTGGLRKRIRVEIPDLERREPERHDGVMEAMASVSGGAYYVGMSAALGRDGGEPVTARLVDRTERTTVSVGDAAESLWDHPAVMLAICGLFGVEWILRRFLRLA